MLTYSDEVCGTGWYGCCDSECGCGCICACKSANDVEVRPVVAVAAGVNGDEPMYEGV